MSSPTGRFAPSPTGALHLGNLRTALASWCSAVGTGGRWLVRMEDLDRVTSSAGHGAAQLADLAALGLRPDGEVLWQSTRFRRYRQAIEQLDRCGLVYECFCTRSEIRQASSAPHAPVGAYPGTCRTLTESQRASRRAEGRTPALRLRSGAAAITVNDRVTGPFTGAADDVVLQRNDGVPAYHLAVVVDDADQGVTEVVRGDDLLAVTPSQVLLQRLLELPTPQYAHVPLVLGADGTRLAKRHGAVTLAQLTVSGWDTDAVGRLLATSLGIDPSCPADPYAWATAFRWARVPSQPWIVSADLQPSAP